MENRKPEAAAAIPKKLKNISRSPENAASAGHSLWSILGGESANIRNAAEALAVHESRLSKLLRSHLKLTPKKLADEKWAEKLAMYFPAGWAQHGTAFKTRVAAESALRQATRRKPGGKLTGSKKHNDPQGTWKQAVGMFVRQIRENMGDEIGDLLPDVKSYALQKPGRWQSVEQGDRTLTNDMYRSALREIVTLYALDSRDPRDADVRQAQQLRAAEPEHPGLRQPSAKPAP